MARDNTRDDKARSTLGSRERLVRAANQLFSRQGYEATGLKDVATHGSAPIGSLYFHFPGGKQELAVAAMGYGVDEVGRLFAKALDSSKDLGRSFAAVARALAGRLESSDWDAGCPIATTALEMAYRNDVLRASSQLGLTTWQELFVERAVRAGLTRVKARDLAVSVLALLEGAELLARVERSSAPLKSAARALEVLGAAAVSRRREGAARDR